MSDSVPELPDSILLEVLGSRKPVVFVEGDRGSLDVAILQAVYPAFHIIPRGGCAAVIQSTKALKQPIDGIPSEVYGIIDRDFRSEPEIKSLREHGIYVLPVAEIENLLCREEVLRVVVEHLALPVEATVASVKGNIIKWLDDEFDVQVASRVGSELKFKLSLLETTTKSADGVSSELSSFLSSIDVQELWGFCDSQLRGIIKSQSFDDCLCYYNRKSLPRRIAPLLGLQAKSYPELMLNLMRSSHRAKIISAFTVICPEIGNSRRANG